MEKFTQNDRMNAIYNAVMKTLNIDGYLAEEWLDEFADLIDLNAVIDYGTALDEVERVKNELENESE
jgi:type II secretory pathway component PulK